MTKVTTDIDIDFGDRDFALDKLLHVPATRHTGEQILKHPTGVYFQNIPTDPVTGFAALDYEKAADNGYFKIDFLNNNIYNGIKNENHLVELMNEPDWDLFNYEPIVERLAHIHDKFGLVKMIKPKSIEDLAIILALMRPGKRHLIGKSRSEIDAEIWQASADGGYQFRRSHAIAYAVSIVVQLNLICEQTGEQIDNSK